MHKASKRRRSTRRRAETHSSGPTVLGGERSCMEDSSVEKNGSQNSCVREIPGFYYDPEKKRYFKITKDHPGKKLVLCHCGGWKDATAVNHNRVIPSNIKVTKKPSRISIAVNLKHREYTCHSQTPSRNMLEKLTRLLKLKQKLTLDPSSYDYFEMDRFSVSRIEPDACHEKILTLYDTKPTGNQIVQFHDLLKDQYNNLDVVQNMAMMKNQKITGLLWSPHRETKNIYIVSLLGYGNMSGETMIFEVDGGSQRKLKNTLPIIIDLQCVQRAMATCI